MGGSSKGKQYIGDKFFLGMHQIICQAPIDKITKMTMGEKTVWSGDVSSNSEISINQPELFGGERKEGGVVGNIDLEFGGDSQPVNSYLDGQISGPLSAFRGLVGAVFKQTYLASMSPYIKSSFWTIKSIKGKEWYPSKAEINGGNNPAHIVYFCITEILGISQSEIDLTSLQSAADVFYDENLGLSMILSGGDVEKFFEDIERHTHSIILRDSTTGLFTMKPLRGDYDVSGLQEFNNSNITKITSHSKPSYGTLVNEIVIKYKPQGGDSLETITLQNLGSIQAQGVKIEQEVTYEGIDSHAGAMSAGNIDLSMMSTPLASVKFKANRQAASLKKGDVISLTWESSGLVIPETVMRITEVDYGNLKNREVSVSCIEDVFAVVPTEYLQEQESLFEDPIQPTTEAINKRLLELNYWDVKYNYTESATSVYDDDSAFLSGLMGEESKYISEWELWAEIGNGGMILRATDQVCPIAELEFSISKTDTVIDIVNESPNVYIYPLESLAYIGDEIVIVYSFSGNQITIGRGCLDTTPQEHAAGERIWFYEQNTADAKDEFSEGVSFDAKHLMKNGIETYPLASALESSITLTGRFGRPWSAGNFRINGQSHPTSITGNLLVSWSHRDRNQQIIKPVVDTSFGDFGPEAGVTYTLTIYAADGTTVLRTITGITGNSYEWTDELVGEQGASNRVTLQTFRGADESHQFHEATVLRNY